jgi:hypothetical protein
MEKKSCGNDCKDMSPACVSFFVHENTVQHMNISNKRMLIALLTVCITFILTIVVFVVGYTVRERNWLDTLTRMNVTEEADGIQQQPDP